MLRARSCDLLTWMLNHTKRAQRKDALKAKMKNVIGTGARCCKHSPEPNGHPTPPPVPSPAPADPCPSRTHGFHNGTRQSYTRACRRSPQQLQSLPSAPPATSCISFAIFTTSVHFSAVKASMIFSYICFYLCVSARPVVPSSVAGKGLLRRRPPTPASWTADIDQTHTADGIGNKVRFRGMETA